MIKVYSVLIKSTACCSARQPFTTTAASPTIVVGKVNKLLNRWWEFCQTTTIQIEIFAAFQMYAEAYQTLRRKRVRRKYIVRWLGVIALSVASPSILPPRKLRVPSGPGLVLIFEQQLGQNRMVGKYWRFILGFISCENYRLGAYVVVKRPAGRHADRQTAKALMDPTLPPGN